MKRIAFPIAIIAIGLGWLLTVQEVVPGVNWIWVLALGTSGLLIPAVEGVDKATMLIGPFLVLASFMSLLRQTGRLSVDTEVPLLVIGFGAFLLMVQLSPLRLPKWLYDSPSGNGEG